MFGHLKHFQPEYSQLEFLFTGYKILEKVMIRKTNSVKFIILKFTNKSIYIYDQHNVLNVYV